MSETDDPRITPVILSGGAGTRLWPMSRRARPKQLHRLDGPDSMLRQTIRRVADATLFAPPILVAGADQADEAAAELDGKGTLIVEPAARNTAPAVALAALAVQSEDLLLALPSDHVIRKEAAFLAAIRRAAGAAREGWILTFGMKAERPETGYGYVRRAEAIGDGVFRVGRFVEKPDRATAEAYVADGAHDWNGGIFLMRADTYLDALRAHAPDILAAAEAAMRAGSREGGRILPDRAEFAAAPTISIDYAVMEKADRIAVAPVEAGWSDVGSWAALHDLSIRDADGNALDGAALAIDSKDCLIRSDGPLVAAIGVTGLVIVASGNAVLVVPRGDSQRVKEAVDALKAKGEEAWL